MSTPLDWSSGDVILDVEVGRVSTVDVPTPSVEVLVIRGKDGAVPNATTTAKGGIVLAGDLAGTWDAPTVPGLGTKVDKVGAASRLYGTDAANVQTTLAYTSSAATASTIAQRGAAGVLVVGTPTAATHATTKAYVDAGGASLTTALAGKADLSGGKLVASQLPDMAIVDYLGTVANQAAMLALTGQKGDWAIRSDLGTVWIIVGDPTVVTGWQQVAYPAAPVSSVAGKTGAVTLTAGDIASGTFAIGRIPVGTTGLTVTVGNDARLSDTRTPTDGTVTTAKIVDANVTTAKIADTAVTLGKLATAVQTSLGKADTAVQGNDARLSDARTPLDGSVSTAKLRNGAVTVGKLGSDVAGAIQGMIDTSVLGAQLVAINAQTAAYTLDLTDANKAVEVTTASAVAVTVPPDSSKAFAVGTVIEVVQLGAGQVILTPGSGVTLQQASGLKTRAQYSVVVLRKRAADVWIVAGDTVA